MKPIYNIYLAMLKNLNLKWKFLEYQRKVRADEHKRIEDIENRHAHELTSEKEIAEIIGRIECALEK